MSLLDGDRIRALTGPERGTLGEVLRRAFPARADWERLLLFRLDRYLADYAPQASDLRDISLRVVEAAAVDDWLVDLVEAALATSGNRQLREWARPYLTAGPKPAGGPEDRPEAALAAATMTGSRTATAAPSVSGDDPPVVFVSYGHGADDDDQFGLFVDDLRAAIVRATGVGPARALYVDTSLSVGVEWSPELVEALSRCRVLMPFYSVSLMSSRGCGREWAYFTQRQDEFERATGRPAGSIVPVLWDNPANYADRLAKPPFPAVQFAPNGAEFRRYRERGLRHLYSRRDTFGTEVRTVRDYLADLVADLTRRPPLPPGPLAVAFDAIAPAFGGA
ncbi:hypothetical protein ACG83_12385 [Frankia sp. R43]|uniref:effector-associated domain EAD1-containing protein n=1 Tax=Frankia sp. R43 TaxID=269536 RepID=UPI0006CA0074|nr:effector-associated domain EAD1-containing protein [Frankia sp. R43]KPM55989.1 hypothetical protein ACG83_12385 [Frankia sp. R43]